MLEDKIIERISKISLEDAMEELHLIAPTMSPSDSKQWFNLYEKFTTDRRAYRIIGMPESIEPSRATYENKELAQTRLKLLSYYSWKNNEEQDAKND